ncbi:hypothetical protein PV342_12460 [Streptomyces sp. PA03-3a]|nr:hypothetical protein [Streptomyces sp. PA03-3a]
MATKSILARPTADGGFAGRHVQCDGFPSARIFTLGYLVSDVHRGDVEAAARALLDEHPNGWVSLPRRGNPGECYCHSGDHSDRLYMGLLTEEGTADGRYEYAYVLHTDLLAIYEPNADGTNWVLKRRITWADRQERPAVDRRFTTRVCIDDSLGPFDAVLDPANRWNGFLKPYFTLDTARRVAAQTQQAADERGHDSVDCIYVLDGGTRAGEPRAVVVHVSWQWHDEENTGASIIEPNAEGLYSIGGGAWGWHFASWWCACGVGMDWHITHCEGCGLPRPQEASAPLTDAAEGQ